MKKSMFYIAFVMLAILSVTQASATIRRVGYFGTFTSGTDYGSLQSAHDNSLQGDTIYIYPGQWSAYFNRKIILIGYGYFTSGSNSNSGLQNIIGSLGISIDLNTGADSSVIQGIEGLTINCRSYTNNIYVNRCHFNIYYGGSTQNKWRITQSYLENFSAICCGYGIFSNLLLANCYISNFQFNNVVNGGSSGILSNNIFNGNADFQNCSFNLKNNIFINGHNNDAYCSYQYNVATTTYLLFNTDGNDTANKNVADISTVFVGYPNLGNHSFDERYNLKMGSVAFTAGEGGTQAGIYGGSDPYQLSGIPPIPAFYKLTAPSTTTSSNPYTITFSVRSNN